MRGHAKSAMSYDYNMEVKEIHSKLHVININSRIVKDLNNKVFDPPMILPGIVYDPLDHISFREVPRKAVRGRETNSCDIVFSSAQCTVLPNCRQDAPKDQTQSPPYVIDLQITSTGTLARIRSWINYLFGSRSQKCELSRSGNKKVNCVTNNSEKTTFDSIFGNNEPEVRVQPFHEEEKHIPVSIFGD